jgi:hypothetical protein
MTRRAALGILAAAIPVSADSESEVWDVIAAMAAALAEDNPPAFLKPIDPQIPGYGELSENLEAMVQQADVHSSIAPLGNEGNDVSRTLELDWELRLTRKGAAPRMQVREQAIKVALHRDAKRWRVVKLDPVAFFAPPDFG